jgi:magnesium transporter
MNFKVRKSVVQFKGLFNDGATRRVNRKPPGQAPGTILHTGLKKMDEVLMTVHDYDESHYEAIQIKEIEKSAPYLSDASKTWIQVRGLHDIDKLKQVWDFFELHPLIQEDIVSISQRPKVEAYGDVIFLVMRMITGKSNGTKEDFKTEQVSMVLGSNYVLSFQESDEPIFEPVIRRLELQTTRLRRLGVDYLAYALLDNVVDHYFTALDSIGETIETIEERILENPKSVHLQSIHALRRDLIYFRKSIWSLRDGINSLIRDDSPLIGSEVKIYIRDVYDHVVQVIDSIENHREMVYSLYDMYMSSISNRMNEVMKVLTIIATIFIPLTFVAGIYGMNFNTKVSPLNMPELNWAWGYPFALGIMGVMAVGMLVYFRRKGWI